MKPVQPDFIPMPFAENGNKNTIPTEWTKGTANASYEEGFPQITEQPKELGGIPPQRKDFNGILNALSTLMFFVQSGGKYSYSNKVNYKTPCIVYYSGVLYWCLKENGPDTEVKEPTAANKAYWITLIEFLKANADAVGIHIGGGVPLGTIIIWAYAKEPPSDSGVWLDCDGRNVSNYPDLVAAIGSETIPDFRGLFLRGQGQQTVSGTVYNGGTVGSKAIDTGRNATGVFPGGDSSRNWESQFSGVFRSFGSYNHYGNDSADWDNPQSKLDLSLVWKEHAGDEFKPANATVRFLIKAQ